MRAWLVGLGALTFPCIDTFMSLRTGKGILLFDKEPWLIPASSPVHAHQGKLTLEFCTVQRKCQLTCFDTLCHGLRARPVCVHVVVGAVIPDGHRPGPVLSRRNRTRECRIGERVVFNMDRQALQRRIHRGGLRHRPALEDTPGLQAEIVMESTGMVLLHYKYRPVPLARGRRDRRGRGFRGLLESALGSIRVESHGGLSWLG